MIIVLEVWIWLYEQMVYAQPRKRPGKWDTQSLLGCLNRNGSFNVDQTSKPSDSQKQKQK